LAVVDGAVDAAGLAETGAEAAAAGTDEAEGGLAAAEVAGACDEGTGGVAEPPQAARATLRAAPARDAFMNLMRQRYKPNVNPRSNPCKVFVRN